MLLASSEQRLGMLLNILQYTGHRPTAKNYSAQNVDSTTVEKSCFDSRQVSLVSLDFNFVDAQVPINIPIP